MTDLGNGVVQLRSERRVCEPQGWRDCNRHVHLHGDGWLECIVDRDGDGDDHRRERCAGCGQRLGELRSSTGLRCRWRRPTPIRTWATATASRSARPGTKGTVTDLGNGVFSYDPNGAFASLKAGATATDTFTYTVTDGSKRPRPRR